MQVLNNTDVQVGLDSNGRPNVAVVPKTPKPAAIQAQVRYTKYQYTRKPCMKTFAQKCCVWNIRFVVSEW